MRYSLWNIMMVVCVCVCAPFSHLIYWALLFSVGIISVWIISLAGREYKSRPVTVSTQSQSSSPNNTSALRHIHCLFVKEMCQYKPLKLDINCPFWITNSHLFLVNQSISLRFLYKKHTFLIRSLDYWRIIFLLSKYNLPINTILE